MRSLLPLLKRRELKTTRVTPVPAPGGQPGGGNGGQNPDDKKDPSNETQPTLPSGAVFTDRGDFVLKMQAAGCTIAKEATPSAPGEKYTPLLVSLARPQDPWRALIEAKEDMCLKFGQFMGRAGHGRVETR